MKPFDHTVDFVFPESQNVFLMVMGREPGQSFYDISYPLNYHYLSDTHTQIKAGYLNSLTDCYTDLSVAYDGFSYRYKNPATLCLRTEVLRHTGVLEKISDAVNSQDYFWRPEATSL